MFVLCYYKLLIYLNAIYYLGSLVGIILYVLIIYIYKYICIYIYIYTLTNLPAARFCSRPIGTVGCEGVGAWYCLRMLC